MRLSLSLIVALLPSAIAAQRPPAVTLERLAGGNWRATYHLATPTSTLTFDRPAGFFRERVWHVSTPGYHFGRAAALQIATLDSGAAPRAEIVFEFPEYTGTLPKEYELFQPFSGGAVAVYTGHFNARADGDTTERGRIRAIDVIPPAGAHAIVRGKVVKGRVTYADAEGTYIYVGTTQPIETPDVVAVVDPGMPQWLATLFSRELPRLFAAYRDRFGYKLPWKPVVLYSFHDTASMGLSSGGGSLTGLVNMTLTGASWKTETKAAAEQAFHLIAHESAHLWNGQLASNKDQRSGSWMHEGSADAMANEMLYALGVIDSARYRVLREDVLNRCAKAVSTGPVADAISRGAVKDVYDCGFVMSMWTDAAVKRANPSKSLFTVWHDLIGAAQAADSAYDQALYFDVLRRNGVADDVVARMRAFLTNRDSMTIAIAGLRALNVPVVTGEGPPPPAFQLQLARAAFEHLMSQACRRISFTLGPPVKTSAVAGCEPFATEHLVYAIDGHRVRDDGAALYDAVSAACDARGSVTLQSDDGSAISTVPCTRAIAPRPAWYALRG